MNILKLVKGQFSTSAKEVERRSKVINGIVNNIDSCHGIVQVVHTSAYTSWTPTAQKQLKESFDKRLGSNTYSLMKPSERAELLAKVANDVGRSTTTVRVRLSDAGLIKVRGNSKATLRVIANKASA